MHVHLSKPLHGWREFIGEVGMTVIGVLSCRRRFASSVRAAVLLTLALITSTTAAALAPQIRPGFSPEDYPPTAMERHEEGTVYMQLLIDPTGQVDSCSVVQSSGYGDLDLQTCAMAKRRLKFIPAKDQDGHNVFALLGLPITWVLSQAPMLTVQPDLDLKINHGPPGMHMPKEIGVTYFITTAGAVSQCHGSDPTAPEELVDVACKLLASSSAEIVHDHSGTPVTAMDCVTVWFSVK